MKRPILSFFVLLLLCLLAFGAKVLAQEFNTVPQDDIEVSMSPQNPGANQTVSVSVVSYSTNIDAATISWQVNGKTVQSGLGLKTFSFQTGNTNTTTTLNIVIKTAERQTIDKTLSIKPGSVDLVWQTDSYTPPFYKGKALFSYQNLITFIAVPHIIGSNGVEISAKNLIYKWTLNSNVLGSSGGAGKNTLSLVGSIISRPMDVVVEVTSPSDNSVADAETVVAPVDPSVVLYKKDPLYGIEFQTALQNGFTLTGSQEMTVVGVPFFFGTLNSGSPSLSYKWSVNGTPIADDGHQVEQVFRQTAGTSGVANIALEMDNTAKVLQTAHNSFNLNFGASSTQTTSAF